MNVALIQMRTGLDKAANVATAVSEIRAAAQQGADLAVLPEMFCCPYDHKYFAPYSEPAGGPVWRALSEAAQSNPIWVVGGSFPESDGDQLYNTCFVFDRTGRQAARHRKVHLFDAAITDGPHFRESDTLSAGSQITLFDTEFGRLGLCICFDIRFPELFLLMSQAGAKAIIVPAAFNSVTGAAHWELLFRSRAVDAQVFAIGVSPARNQKGYISYGHSIVCSPWGEVLAEAEYAPCTQIVPLDFAQIEQVRQQLPLLSARRDDLYQLIQHEKKS